MKLNVSLIIEILNDALYIAINERHNAELGGVILAYKTHLEIYYKPNDMISLPEQIVNLLISLTNK